jgi:hypothetical protein
LIVPIQAFVDESGSKNQDQFLVLAGLIGTVESWVRFSDQWRAALSAKPSIPAFHMRDAVPLKGAFKGWTQTERDNKILALAETVRGFDFTAIHSSIDMIAFSELLPPPEHKPKGASTRLMNLLREPYHLAFNAMIMAVSYELLDQKQSERFEMFFDKSGLGLKAREWYPVWRYTAESRVQAIAPIEPFFRSDDDEMPLQAADLLAWVLRRELSETQQHTFDWIAIPMSQGVTWSGRNQPFDRPRLERMFDRGLRQPISQEMITEINYLLGLKERGG